jgi:succinyl-CoA synthetase alpha subunit
MGYAGALLSHENQGAAAKFKALQDAGPIVVPHPGVTGVGMKRLLDQ